MTLEEVEFISKMILDEMLELWATLKTSEESKAALTALVTKAAALKKEEYSDDQQGKINQVAAQADALIDIQYYMLNCAAKKGFNMSAIFGVVHAANMAKRNPETGRFEKNADGKVIKPPGWKPPNVEGELARQFKEGSWGHKESIADPSTPTREADRGLQTDGSSPSDEKESLPARRLPEISEEPTKGASQVASRVASQVA